MNCFQRVAFSAFSLLCLAGISFGATLDFTLGQKGLTSLKYGTTEFITDSSYGVFCGFQGNSLTMVYKRANGTTYNVTGPNTWSLDSATKTVTASRSTGSASCQYIKSSDSTLTLQIVVRNLSADTLIDAKIPMVALATPSEATLLNSTCWRDYGFDCTDWADSDNPISGAVPYRTLVDASGHQENPLNAFEGSNPGWPYENGPGVILLDMGGTACVSLCNLNDPKGSFCWTIPRTGGFPTVKMFVNIAPYLNLTTLGVYRTTVLPHDSVTLKYSLRFTGPGLSWAKFKSIGSDVIMNYSGELPSQFAQTWPDRRPIGRNFMADIISSGKTGEALRTDVMARADACISVLRKLNAQGCVTWDIEGDPGCCMYVGDPDMIDSIAPHMNYKGSRNICIVDEFFKKITDAGFKTGVCVRPQEMKKINGTWQNCGNQSRNLSADILASLDPVMDVLRDIDYCYKRWDMRLFYVDSNIEKTPTASVYSRTMPAEIWMKKLYEQHPDVLAASECATTNYFRWSTNLEYTVNLGTVIDMVYPDAFSCGMPDYQPPLAPISRMVNSIRRGDIMWPNAWYWGTDGSHDSLAKAYHVSAGLTYNSSADSIPVLKRPVVKINSVVNGTNSITINASASDIDGNITKVEFLSAGIKLGEDEDNTAPYTFNWKDAPQGKHSLYARVTDNQNMRSCSPPFNVTVIGTNVSVKDNFNILDPTAKMIRGPLSVCVYSINGRLVRKLSYDDAARFATNAAIRGLSSGLYVLKMQHANGTIIKRKIEAVW